MKHMKKKVWIPILCAVVVLIGGIAGWLIYSNTHFNPNSSPKRMVENVIQGINQNDASRFHLIYPRNCREQYFVTDALLENYRGELQEQYGEDVKITCKFKKFGKDVVAPADHSEFFRTLLGSKFPDDFEDYMEMKTELTFSGEKATETIEEYYTVFKYGGSWYFTPSINGYCRTRTLLSITCNTEKLTEEG